MFRANRFPQHAWDDICYIYFRINPAAAQFYPCICKVNLIAAGVLALQTAKPSKNRFSRVLKTLFKKKMRKKMHKKTHESHRKNVNIKKN